MNKPTMFPIESLVNRIPAWNGAKNIFAEQIAGLTNTNYRVSVDGQQYVLRISGDNTERLGINRQHEVAALKAAAAAGLAPELVAFIQPEGHLVTRWSEGRHWSTAEFRCPENVRLLTETVKQIHHLRPAGASFSAIHRTLVFLDTATRYGVNLPPDLVNLQKTMQAVEADQSRDTSDWQRFCHNDLVSVNYLFLETQRSIKVLDWEFSGWGDLYYDLATIVYTHDSNGPISEELENVMLECYFGSFTAWHRKRLAGMKFMLVLFTGAWGLVQHGMQQAGLIPAVEGFDYLEFAEYLFSHDIADQQTQYWRNP